MNTYLFWALFIISNLILGMAITGYETIQDDTWLRDDTAYTGLLQISEDFESEQSKWGNVKGTNTQLQETTFGNSISWSKLIFDTFTNAVDPFPIEIYSDNTTEEMLTHFINIFILIVFKGFGILELIFVIKNRKTV